MEDIFMEKIYKIGIRESLQKGSKRNNASEDPVIYNALSQLQRGGEK